MIPNNITKEHLEEALKEINEQGIPKQRKSSDYDLVYEGDLYPPKLVVSIANKYANGVELDSGKFNGGAETNNFLISKGFQITQKNDPIKQLIDNYKKRILENKLKDEVYKWELVNEFRGHPDINTSDIYNEIKNIKYGNLIHYHAIGVMLHLAKEKPKDVIKLFTTLFDENIDLKERVNMFNQESEKIYRKINKTDPHHQDERSMATYLTFYNPDKYIFYKNSFYRKYCKLIGEKQAKTNEKYTHYLELINDLIENYIKQDEELIELVKSLIPEYYDGTNNNILAQDILYQMLDQESETTFEQIKNKFEQNIFDTYISYLRKIVDRLNIQPNDERVVYSIRENNSLNFTVGQRYCFNLYLNNTDGTYGVISTEKLTSNSEPFNGGKPPKPFYNYFQEFSPSDSEWIDIIDTTKTELDRTTKSGYRKYNNTDFEKYVFEDQYTSTSKEENMNFPLNTILYGPPGTGKTYNTIVRAAQIIENRVIESYDEALEIFKTNLHNRIEFITFHQNYSYEDFIQGLRPETDNKSSLVFDKKDGVFKKIADKALENIRLSKKGPSELTSESRFNIALDKFKDVILENEDNYAINDTAYIFEVEEDAFRYTGEKWTNHTNGLRMKFSDLKEFYRQNVKSRKDIKNLTTISGLANQHATYYFLVYEQIIKYLPSEVDTPDKVQKLNYVIIIDEINRANISRVFGELITLIEPDKRSHGSIPLEARLPSGDPFIVPSNLYIIGTMNTADKSIALLDIALRRRFEFESMYPQYEIKNEEIYDIDILQKINEQIIKSKGHDFQIGHAYFMGENEDLVKRMNNKVIPLLLEYYMNDEKEVKGILNSAGLKIEDNSWPLRISGKND